ncbi:MAG: threonine synthase [Lewinellaceae bacterium]|nr:threonine synthase [Phaeodactylibacter sp.]MCB9038101.1 threonine synthase [Lewinellaceae bacterium]
MKLYSTKNKEAFTNLKHAVLKGLPDDNGLYMPQEIPQLPVGFIKNLSGYSFQEIAFTIARVLFKGVIPDEALETIIHDAVNFPAPVVRLDEEKYVLELFHGPSLAFKDFGARFMAQLMSYFNQEETGELVVLVATSGDTGGAVAAGFLQAPGTRVVILYPSGKVSMLQEKQLTTLGHNITALEVDGTFDDCQAMVKQAFLDKELTQKIRLTSANSINISRLIPQTFYYFEAYKQLPHDGRPVAFSVPSGNFGNLTAGLMAQRMGLPVHHFIAATNINDVVPGYLDSGRFSPRPSMRTISNAMDVGNPSNFARMLDLYDGKEEGSTWNNMRKSIDGYAFDDDQTRKALFEVYQDYHYVIDPHGAVGYLALKQYQTKHNNTKGVILETAHPAKFLDEVEQILNEKVEVPERLAILAGREKKAVRMPADFEGFREWLWENIS